MSVIVTVVAFLTFVVYQNHKVNRHRAGTVAIIMAAHGALENKDHDAAREILLIESGKIGATNDPGILETLGVTEIAAGNHDKAIEYFERQIAVIDRILKGELPDPQSPFLVCDQLYRDTMAAYVETLKNGRRWTWLEFLKNTVESGKRIPKRSEPHDLPENVP